VSSCVSCLLLFRVISLPRLIDLSLLFLEVTDFSFSKCPQAAVCMPTFGRRPGAYLPAPFTPFTRLFFRVCLEVPPSRLPPRPLWSSPLPIGVLRFPPDGFKCLRFLWSTEQAEPLTSPKPLPFSKTWPDNDPEVYLELSLSVHPGNFCYIGFLM